MERPGKKSEKSPDSRRARIRRAILQRQKDIALNREALTRGFPKSEKIDPKFARKLGRKD